MPTLATIIPSRRWGTKSKGEKQILRFAKDDNQKTRTKSKKGLSDGGVDQRLGFGLDLFEVVGAFEAFGVDLVDVFGARGAGGEPAFGGGDLETADAGVVA